MNLWFIAAALLAEQKGPDPQGAITHPEEAKWLIVGCLLFVFLVAVFAVAAAQEK